MVRSLFKWAPSWNSVYKMAKVKQLWLQYGIGTLEHCWVLSCSLQMLPWGISISNVKTSPIALCWFFMSFPGALRKNQMIVLLLRVGLTRGTSHSLPMWGQITPLILLWVPVARSPARERVQEPEDDEGSLVQWAEPVNSYLNSPPNLLRDF